MELTRSLVWALSKDIGQMGAKSPEECNEIFSDLTNYLNSKYELNLSANVNQSEIDNYNTLFQCYCGMASKPYIQSEYYIFAKT